MSTDRAERIAAAKAALSHLALESSPAVVRQKSRDFYWYSPILKDELAEVSADFIVAPASEAEVIEVLAACHRFDVPVTPRGGGSGNYGQAMPLAGGVVLDLTRLNTIGAITTTPAANSIRVGAGALIHDIDRAAADAGLELRIYPSTWKTATIGGFVAGGAGGIGSVKWGGLRTPGNVRSARVVTMDAEPRALDLIGEGLGYVTHAYGVNGIITELEIALAPRIDWVEVLIGCTSFAAAAELAAAIGGKAGTGLAPALLDIRNLSVWHAAIPHAYFRRHRAFLPQDAHVVGVLVSPATLDALADVATSAGADVLFRSDRDGSAALPPFSDLAWNHTTLRAIKPEPDLTYLQVLYTDIAQAVAATERFAGECISHLEFTRFNGHLTCLGVPLVRFTSKDRLEALIAEHEAVGITVFNPHRFTLEEGGMKKTDPAQLAFKRRTDPKGLLNPGKMIAWDRPDWDFSSNRIYVFDAAAAGSAPESA